MDLDLDTDVWELDPDERKRKQLRPQLSESEIALSERQQLQADYARAMARAEQQEHQAQALFALSQSISVALELDDLRQSIVESLYESMRADTASLFLREDDGNLRMVAQCNIDLTRARIVFGADEGLVALAAREHRVVHVPDTSAHHSYVATAHDHPRSLLAVPVEPQTGPSYVLCIVRRRLYAFTDDEVQFGSLMASVAAQALSNAALYGEMSNLAREQATLYELARASSISDGVTDFIERAVEPLRLALNAGGCAILLAPESASAVVAHSRSASQGLSAHGLSQCEAFVRELAQHNSPECVAIRCDVSPDGARLVLSPIVARGRPLAVIGWEMSGTVMAPAADETIIPLNTVWGAALHLNMDIPAVVMDHSYQFGPSLPLSDAETTFITSVGQQLALGIENLQLRVRDHSALRSISALPASRPHLDHVRRSIVAEVANAFTPAVVALIMRDEHSGEPRVVATSHDGKAGWIQGALRLLEKCADGEVQQHRGIVVAPLVTDGDIVGWLALRMIGMTSLSADRALVLSSLAGAAALILRNARLHLMAREAAVDRERQRIAREMHDGVAQNLAHLMLRLELVQRLVDVDPERAKTEAEGARQVLFASLNDLRQSIAALAPAQLEELGFAGAVQSILDDILTNTPELHVSFASCPDDAIPPELRAPAFRVVQEALANIRKHADARQAWITVERSDGDTLRVVIRDDGQGFVPDLDGPANGHFGLRGMRDRAEEFGGALAIISTPGGGTTVTLTLPLALAA
jgi:signal transduction histidine kinase/putative methionine-R-sulfoxide reductase with GAF domain